MPKTSLKQFFYNSMNNPFLIVYDYLWCFIYGRPMDNWRRIILFGHEW